MRRILTAVFVLFALLAVSSLAEREIYAEQDGVRVFRENGLVGLMDADENVLLDARFKVIYPFTGDYAIIRDGTGCEGIVCKDGRIAIPCEYGRIDIWAEYGRATVYPEEYEYGCTFIDLTTGETLLQGEKITMEGGDVIRHITGGDVEWDEELEEPFLDEGPIRSDVFDSDLRFRFSVDSWIDRRLGEGLYLVERNPEDSWFCGDEYDALVDERGTVLIDDLCEDPDEDEEGILYTRVVRNPLRILYDWFRKIYPEPILRARQQIKNDKSAFRCIRGMLANIKISGILRADGSRMEIIASDLKGRDEEGLYRVGQNGSWGYADDNGDFVIPAIYREAGAFVNGSAIVSPKEKEYFLIDRNGTRVGDLVWEDNLTDIPCRDGNGFYCKQSDITWAVPVRVGDRIYLYGRDGNRLVDEAFYLQLGGSRFHWAWGSDCFILSVSGRTAALRDTNGNVCLIRQDGRIPLRVPAETISYTNDDNLIRIRTGGKWGILDLSEENQFRWVLEPVYQSAAVSGQYDNTLLAGTGDSQSWYMRMDGEIICPADEQAW